MSKRRSSDMTRKRLLIYLLCGILALGSIVAVVFSVLHKGDLNKEGEDASVVDVPDRNYDFNGMITEEVLKNYLSRAVTHAGLCASVPETATPFFEEDLRMLLNIGAKFIGRAAVAWTQPPDEEEYFRQAAERVAAVHEEDPEIILQACVFEAIFPGIENVPIPEWVFTAYGLEPENRNFNYKAMLYPRNKGVNVWGPGGSIPDMSRLETKMWFYYRAVRFIDAGFEAIHFGQIHQMSGNDPGYHHWMEMLTLVREYAAKNARRGMVLCDAHTNGVTLDNRLLFDFHSFPIGFNIKDKNGEKTGELEYGLRKGTNVGIVGKSRGGITPSGWKTKSLPYLVEFDNADAKDDICWFASLSEEERNSYLRHSWEWVREQDPQGFVQFPTRRILARNAELEFNIGEHEIPREVWNGVVKEALIREQWEEDDGKHIRLFASMYRANMAGPAVPNGFNQELTIKEIWENDRALEIEAYKANPDGKALTTEDNDSQGKADTGNVVPGNKDSNEAGEDKSTTGIDLDGESAVEGSTGIQDKTPTSGGDDDLEEDGLVQGIVTGRYYAEMAADPHRFFKEWHDMGIKWIRIEFEEFASQDIVGLPERVDNYSKIIKTAHEYGIKVLGIVGYNSLQNKEGFPDTDESIDRYVDAVEWHLKVYPVDAVEISNEPSVYLTNGDNRRLERYARMMIETYRRLKPLYPDRLFVAPVSANAERGEWLGYHGWPRIEFRPEESIFNCTVMQEYRDENNGRLPLDIVSWHPYGSGGDPLDGRKSKGFYFGRDFETYFKEIMDYRDIKDRPIIGEYPIWFTEYSWDSELVGEEKQRTYYEGMLSEMKKHPQIKAAFIYTWQDDENVPNSEFKHYGLIKNSEYGYERKKVYYAFFANNSGVGLMENGKTIDEFVIAYKDNGGREVLGSPVDNVYSDESGHLCQDFAGGRLIMEDGVVRWQSNE
jgi:hypothetical protein